MQAVERWVTATRRDDLDVTFLEAHGEEAAAELVALRDAAATGVAHR
jgi:hypothetical protein